jgi:hypothetical protein
LRVTIILIIFLMHDLFGCHIVAISNHGMTGLEYDIATNASWINIRVSKISLHQYIFL